MFGVLNQSEWNLEACKPFLIPRGLMSLIIGLEEGDKKCV